MKKLYHLPLLRLPKQDPSEANHMAHDTAVGFFTNTVCFSTITIIGPLTTEK